MKAIVDERQEKHDPKQFIVSGVIKPSAEQPERIKRLRAGAEAAGCEFSTPEDAGIAPIAAVHTPEYLAFLQTIYGQWSQMDGAGPEVVPNVHPRSRKDSYPDTPVGLAGYHQADTACPIGLHTWDSVYWSAQTAITAADLVAGGERAAYALSRPPGHHAYADMAGGFCFLNNSAIAAERLRGKGFRPAILDVDVHHGNGTQGIFYGRDDVLTVSIHTDCREYYPFYWGHPEERGAGRGLGYNLNLPLPRGAGIKEYLPKLDQALRRIRDYGADMLVVALGLDPYEGDPLKGMALQTGEFSRITAAIAGLNLPTLLVQEGGYLSDELGDNLTSALTGFENA